MFGSDEKLYNMFYANDYPIPYKNLTIYPVQVDLYLIFHILVECLILPHKTSGDINAIQLSYFDYLFYWAEKNGNMTYLEFLVEVLLLCLKKERTKIVDGKTIDSIKFYQGKNKKWIMQIDGFDYNGKDFDVIRKIICEQNAIELPDETIHPDIAKAYKEMEEYKRKQSKVKICSFEDQINVVVAKSSYRREEVIKMTIRSFARLLERIDKVLHYEIYTLLSPNMDKKQQQSIEHYMSDSSIKDKYKNSMMDFDEFKNKIK